MIVVRVVTEVIDLTYDFVSPSQFTLGMKNWCKKGLKIRLDW